MTPARRQSLLRSGAVRVVVMADIDHPETYIRAWNGVGIISWAGEDYYGFGLLGSITPVRSTDGIEVIEVRFGLSGVDRDLLGDLHASVKGREAILHEAWLDRHYRIVYRRRLVKARLDRPEYAVAADGKVDYAMIGHAGMYQLLATSSAKVSPEEAKALHPDETGYDEIHLQQDLQLPWLPPEA
jgi:hypothetical protein